MHVLTLGAGRLTWEVLKKNKLTLDIRLLKLTHTHTFSLNLSNASCSGREYWSIDRLKPPLGIADSHSFSSPYITCSFIAEFLTTDFALRCDWLFVLNFAFGSMYLSASGSASRILRWALHLALAPALNVRLYDSVSMALALCSSLSKEE